MIVTTSKMKTPEFIALSAGSMLLNALAIDIMLPAFAELRADFGLHPESSATANIVMIFFMGQILTLLFGIISDRHGRLPVLRLGLALYIVGGIVAALAPNLAIMYAARFVAGMGASAVFSTTVAGVRDRFKGDEMAKIMSFIFAIFLVTPVVAPFLGSMILSVSSWHWVFLAPPAFAVLVFAWSFRSEESLPEEKRTAIELKILMQSARSILTNSTFIRYTIISTLLFASFSAYIAGSERIVGQIYGRPDLFSWLFSGVGMLMILGTVFNSRVVVRLGLRRTLRGLVIFYTIASALLLILTVVSDNTPDFVLFFIFLAIIITVNFSASPNSNTLAMAPLEGNAGLGSAIYATFFFFAGALLGSVINMLMTRNVLPFVLSFVVIGLVVLTLVLTDRSDRPDGIKLNLTKSMAITI